MLQNYKYGWLPDIPDIRDLKFSGMVKGALPKKVDLRSLHSLVYDQGALGSCTANALGSAYDFGRVRQKLKATKPSRLFIYYNERAIIGTINSDSGAYIRDGIKTMAKQGVCEETLWPYDITKFKKKTAVAAYKDAKKSTVREYLRLDNRVLRDLKQCLADGYGFVFGFSVYETIESEEVARTGVVPMPKPGEQMLGGHAVFCVGYDDDRREFIIRNSWGSGWGDRGHCYLPYDYVTDPNLADDFWTIRLV
jgi:C1A family cysteine protease